MELGNIRYLLRRAVLAARAQHDRLDAFASRLALLLLVFESFGELDLLPFGFFARLAVCLLLEDLLAVFLFATESFFFFSSLRVTNRLQASHCSKKQNGDLK